MLARLSLTGTCRGFSTSSSVTFCLSQSYPAGPPTSHLPSPTSHLPPTASGYCYYLASHPHLLPGHCSSRRGPFLVISRTGIPFWYQHAWQASDLFAWAASSRLPAGVGVASHIPFASPFPPTPTYLCDIDGAHLPHKRWRTVTARTRVMVVKRDRQHCPRRVSTPSPSPCPWALAPWLLSSSSC